MNSFSETMLKALFDYRGLLKRYFKPVERRAKMQALGLNVRYKAGDDERVLYGMAQRILEDIKLNTRSLSTGYYSYSGIQQFGEHLKALLNQYELQDQRVVHKTQKASCALLYVLQTLSLSGTKLSEVIINKLMHHAQVIAVYGSKEQHQHYRSALEQYVGRVDPHLCGSLLQDFNQGSASNYL